MKFFRFMKGLNPMFQYKIIVVQTNRISALRMGKSLIERIALALVLLRTDEILGQFGAKKFYGIYLMAYNNAVSLDDVIYNAVYSLSGEISHNIKVASPPALHILRCYQHRTSPSVGREPENL